MVTVSTSRRQLCTRRVTGQLWFPMATTRRSVKTFLELAPFYCDCSATGCQLVTLALLSAAANIGDYANFK